MTIRPAALFFLLSVFPSAALAQAAPAQPLDPITTITDAFKTYDVVALGEGNHGNEQGAALRNRLYHDPRFLAAVNDIVVESGNGRHQAMMDRYVAGEDVPEKELRMAWVETTQPHNIWDRDTVADMFRTIREINRTRPKEKQLRVLLGDTPYTYDPANPGAPAYRADSFTADLILREVIAKKRKALTVFGDMHYLRRLPQFASLPGQPAPPEGRIVGLLEKAGVKVFSIWSHTPPQASWPQLPQLQPDIARWPKPSIALIKGTTLGGAPFTFYYPKGTGTTRIVGPNGPVVTDMGEAIGGTMELQFDAILYLGPSSGITIEGQSPSLCADPDYVEMRAKRMALIGAEAGFRMQCKALAEGPRPTPGLEALARKYLAGVAAGDDVTDIVSPGLAQFLRPQRDAMMQRAVRRGPLQSLTFTGPNPYGTGDLYRAVFANYFSTITVVPSADGKIGGFQIGPLFQTPEQRAVTFRVSDGNADGKLNKAEYAVLLAAGGNVERLDNFFAQLDADNDGMVSPKEFETETQ